jgi:hypothetical protein
LNERKKWLDMDQRRRYVAWFEEVSSLAGGVLATVLFTDLLGFRSYLECAAGRDGATMWPEHP